MSMNIESFNFANNYLLKYLKANQGTFCKIPLSICSQ